MEAVFSIFFFGSIIFESGGPWPWAVAGAEPQAVAVSHCRRRAVGRGSGPWPSPGAQRAAGLHVMIQAHMCSSKFRRAPLHLPNTRVPPHDAGQVRSGVHGTAWKFHTVWHHEERSGTQGLDISAMLRAMNNEQKQSYCLQATSRTCLKLTFMGTVLVLVLVLLKTTLASTRRTLCINTNNGPWAEQKLT